MAETKDTPSREEFIALLSEQFPAAIARPEDRGLTVHTNDRHLTLAVEGLAALKRLDARRSDNVYEIRIFGFRRVAVSPALYETSIAGHTVTLERRSRVIERIAIVVDGKDQLECDSEAVARGVLATWSDREVENAERAAWSRS